jgi:hypothetical protein
LGGYATPCLCRSGKPRSQRFSRRQAFLARILIDTMSLSRKTLRST